MTALIVIGTFALLVIIAGIIERRACRKWDDDEE